MMATVNAPGACVINLKLRINEKTLEELCNFFDILKMYWPIGFHPNDKMLNQLGVCFE